MTYNVLGEETFSQDTEVQLLYVHDCAFKLALHFMTAHKVVYKKIFKE